MGPNHTSEILPVFFFKNPTIFFKKGFIGKGTLYVSRSQCSNKLHLPQLLGVQPFPPTAMVV